MGAPHLPIPALPPGAILAPAGSGAQGILSAFSAELIARGFRVAGVTQSISRDNTGRKTGMHLHPVEGGGAISVAQGLGRGSSSCVIDESGMADAAAVLRQGLEDGCDLAVFNKFGHLEQDGRGFHAEILLALSSHRPVLVAIPPEMLEPWLAFSGGDGPILAPTVEALWRWWGPHRLYADLVRSIPPDDAGVVRRVVIGLNWCLVEGDHGAGLAHTPSPATWAHTTFGCKSADASGWVGRPLADLARALPSLNPLEAALGLAAINAFHNRRTLDLPRTSGLDALGPTPGAVVMVGAFPGASTRFTDLTIIEQNPAPGHLPSTAAAGALSHADGAILTASALVNHTLPDLLSPLRGRPAVLTGPGTPLCPRLHAYGLTALAGMVIEDIDGCAAAVAAGAGAKGLKPFGRPALMTP